MAWVIGAHISTWRLEAEEIKTEEKKASHRFQVGRSQDLGLKELWGAAAAVSVKMSLP
jgi:hypothetical protein